MKKRKSRKTAEVVFVCCSKRFTLSARHNYAVCPSCGAKAKVLHSSKHESKKKVFQTSIAGTEDLSSVTLTLQEKERSGTDE